MTDRLRRASTASAVAVLALLAAPSTLTQSAPADRPSIVFILSDDHAYNALGIAGHPHLKTPNLDRLAREGVWFRQAAVVTPLCAPSRAAFLTGSYGHTSGFRTNNRPWPERFPPSFLSVAREAGYRTAFIGKEHIDNTDEPLPGIDRWVSFVNQGWFVNPAMNIDGERRKLTGANGDLLTDFASDFIRANRQGPLAMMVAYKEAHSQQTAPPRFDATFEDVPIALPSTGTRTNRRNLRSSSASRTFPTPASPNRIRAATNLPTRRCAINSRSRRSSTTTAASPPSTITWAASGRR